MTECLDDERAARKRREIDNEYVPEKNENQQLQKIRQATADRKMQNREAEVEKEETKETPRKKRALPVLFVPFP